MNRERWARAQEIAWAALAQPEDARADFVERACEGNALALGDVELLLIHLAADPDFLERPVASVRALEGMPEVPGMPGDRIGPYRMVRPLGQGGMGDVHLAIREGEGFEMPVALKLIRAGVTSREAMARFTRERRILASLRHPNIAALIDGGTAEDGRPYLVMEYVEGEAIDVYAERRGLGVAERVRLVITLCHAVQHAHQNLVVHRDLKPGNVFVTGECVPKLLDFGIGKLLEDDADALDATSTEARLLTPAYAAPEQLRGEPVTTATDVYGLGVLLYLLLTASHPWTTRATTRAALEAAVLSAEPIPPSVAVRRPGPERPSPGAGIGGHRPRSTRRLERALAGDLDTIVLKALRKNPTHRYPSARELADDLARHLDGLPVRARPPSLAYRAGRFVRRRAWAVATAATLIVAVAAGVAMTLVQARRLTYERDKGLEVQAFLLESFGAASADETGDVPTARQLLDAQSARQSTELLDEPALRGDMLEVLAQAYDRLGLWDPGLEHAEKALAQRRAALGEGHPDVSASLATVGWIRHERGESLVAESLLVAAVHRGRRAGRAHRPRMSRALNDLGVVRMALGDYDGAEAVLQEALRLRRSTYGPAHRSVGVTASNLAANLFYRADYTAATTVAEEAVAALTMSVGADHQRTILAQSNLAAMRSAAGDDDGAVDVYRDLLARQERLQGPGAPVTSSVRSALMASLLNQGRLAEAEPLARRAVELARGARGPDHPEVAAALTALGRTLAREGGYVEGEAALRRSIEIQRATFGEGRFELGETWLSLAMLLARQAGRNAEAEDAAREAVRSTTLALGPDHPATRARRLYLVGLLVDTGSLDAASRELATLVRLDLSADERGETDRLQGLLARR